MSRGVRNERETGVLTEKQKEERKSGGDMVNAVRRPVGMSTVPQPNSTLMKIKRDEQ